MEMIFVAVLASVAGLAFGIAMARQPGGRSVTARLESQLAVQAAELRRLADSERSREGGEARLKDGIDGARRVMEELRLRDEERGRRESEHMEVVRRLSTVLVGGSSRGRAGENVLREYFADLPPSLLVTDFRVNGKVVEFGMRLPDGRCLPVDSKWSAVAELQILEETNDPEERARIASIIEKEVTKRAKEVAQYLDASLTAPVAMAAIPDPAYEVLRKAHSDAYRVGVVIVPYSMALPVLLFLYSLVSRYGTSGDVRACLSEIGGVLEGLEQVVENRLARAATMLQNGNDEVRAHIGKARGSIARAGVNVVPEGDQQAALSALRAVE